MKRMRRKKAKKKARKRRKGRNAKRMENMWVHNSSQQHFFQYAQSFHLNRKLTKKK